MKDSGILLILISNRYLESSWCKDEREWFESQLRERAGGLSRIFVVRVQATDHRGVPTLRAKAWHLASVSKLLNRIDGKKV